MRLKDIEKLRALALIMVLLGHMPIRIPPVLIHGYTGVTLFFIISGYVCCLSLENAISRNMKSSMKNGFIDFYLARFFRVIPVISIWLFMYFFVSQVTNQLGGAYGDAYMFFTEIGWWNTGFYNYFFANSRMPGLFGHLWSMAIEMQFYLILPLFYAVFRTSKRRSIGSLFIIQCQSLRPIGSTVRRKTSKNSTHKINRLLMLMPQF